MHCYLGEMGLQNVLLLSLIKFLKSTSAERCGCVLFSLCLSLSFRPFNIYSCEVWSGGWTGVVVVLVLVGAGGVGGQQVWL